MFGTYWPGLQLWFVERLYRKSHFVNVILEPNWRLLVCVMVSPYLRSQHRYGKVFSLWLVLGYTSPLIGHQQTWHTYSDSHSLPSVCS